MKRWFIVSMVMVVAFVGVVLAQSAVDVRIKGFGTVGYPIGMCKFELNASRIGSVLDGSLTWVDTCLEATIPTIIVKMDRVMSIKASGANAVIIGSGYLNDDPAQIEVAVTDNNLIPLPVIRPDTIKVVATPMTGAVPYVRGGDVKGDITIVYGPITVEHWVKGEAILAGTISPIDPSIDATETPFKGPISVGLHSIERPGLPPVYEGGFKGQFSTPNTDAIFTFYSVAIHSMVTNGNTSAVRATVVINDAYKTEVNVTFVDNSASPIARPDVAYAEVQKPPVFIKGKVVDGDIAVK